MSEDLEHLREVIHTILVECGDRVASLGQLWCVLTAYKCCIAAVEGENHMPSEDELKLIFQQTSDGACPGRCGPLSNLASCHYRVTLFDDMPAAVKCLQMLQAGSCKCPELDEVHLFLLDVHSYLWQLMVIEKRCQMSDGILPP